MDCPACKTSTLQMIEHNGISVAYCSDCRGTWIPRAALDALPPPAAVVPSVAEQASPLLAVRHRDTRHLGQRPHRGAGAREASPLVELLNELHRR